MWGGGGFERDVRKATVGLEANSPSCIGNWTGTAAVKFQSVPMQA